MAIRPYKCKICEHTEMFFNYEDKICPKCGSKDMERKIGIPLEMKNVDTMDTYNNIKVERGIEEDIKKRSKKHINDTLDELIDQNGENIAKEQGWLVTDDNGKTWRKRTDFDTGTLHSANKGSKKAERKKK